MYTYTRLLFCLFVLSTLSCKKVLPVPRSSTVNPQQTTTSVGTVPKALTYDIVIYGATSAGVISAVEAAKLGKNVALICTSSRVGGMTAAGLGAIDIGNPNAVGGLTRDYFSRIQKFYGKNKYFYFVEPKVALNTFNQLLSENNVKVYYNERLLLQNGVYKTGTAISTITMESGKIFQGKMFIDASYEGDLMAKANVSYKVGREANSTYNETLNGSSPCLNLKVDPYLIAGDPSSGLLPRLNTTDPVLGKADGYSQSYTFRLCMTKDDNNKVMVTKPADFDSTQYKLLFRRLARNPKSTDFWLTQPLLNNKVDVNGNSYYCTDYIGGNFSYADGDYATRAKIIKLHRSYEQGLIWTLQNDSRVPQVVRDNFANYGLAKDEFTENGNWSTELYIREGRRMIGSMVMTEQNVMGGLPVEDPIGLGSYAIDSHGVQYFVKANSLWVEGFLFSKPDNPYPISYRAIIPQKKDCTNLLVPVCMSASHVAYGSLRMEPQFMIMGQAAATAAALAIDEHVGVQDVDYSSLKHMLLQDNQKLHQ